MPSPMSPPCHTTNRAPGPIEARASASAQNHRRTLAKLPPRLEVAAAACGGDGSEQWLTLDFVEPEEHRAATGARQSVGPVQCPQLKVDDGVHKSESAVRHFWRGRRLKQALQ